jgi:MraZ protein
MRPFFYGSSENRLNTKGQVALPKRFRDVLPEEELALGFVLVRGREDCLYMYTHRQFAEVKARAREVAVEENDPEFLRAFLESAHAVDVDAQGRFVLPAGLRTAAGIGGPGVLFLGMDDRIEVWEPSRREAARAPSADYEAARETQARRIFGI